MVLELLDGLGRDVRVELGLHARGLAGRQVDDREAHDGDADERGDEDGEAFQQILQHLVSGLNI